MLVTLLFSRLYLCLDRQRLSVPYNGRVRIVFSLRFVEERLSRGLQGMVNVTLRSLNFPVNICC